MTEPDYLETASRIARKARLRAHRFWHRLQGKPRAHFLHLGKTGGSAVKYAIENCPNPHTRYVIYLHPHETTLRDVPEGESFFFFLRDPASRFTSGFYSRQRQGRPRYFLRWTPAEEAAFARFSTPNALATALTSPDDNERVQAEAAMKTILHVKDSYWNWFGSEDYFGSRLPDLFFIGFQDRLSSDFDILKSKLSLPDLTLPVDDVHAHRNPANLDRSLDAKATANLRDWYADDYRFMDLCTNLVRERQELRDAG